MEFIWRDDPDIGYYEGILIDDNDKEINQISIWDYTCPFRLAEAERGNYQDRYAYTVSSCCGSGLDKGFDRDESPKRGWGGYRGTPSHTVEDIKRWCENWVAGQYLKKYYETIRDLPNLKAKAEWFESRGYTYTKEEL